MSDPCFVRLVDLYPNQPAVARATPLPPSEYLDATSPHLGLDVYRPLPYFVTYPNPDPTAEIAVTANYALDRLKLKPDISAFSDDTRSILEHYGLFHQRILAMFILRGILSDLEVRELFTEMATKNKLDPAELSQTACIQTCVNVINEKTCSFNLTIRRGCCEIGADEYYSLTLIRKSDKFKFQMYFPPQVVEFRDKIIDHCLTLSPSFSVSYERCLELSWRTYVYGLTKQEPIGIQLAEVYLRNLIKTKYLVTYRPKDSWRTKQVTLGVRSMEEVGHCVLTQYGEIFGTCFMCQKTMLNGHECPKRTCPFVLHRACFKKYINSRKVGERTCPKCKTPWRESRMKERARKDTMYLPALGGCETWDVYPPLDPNLLLPIQYKSPKKGTVYYSKIVT